jgi:hypothetical protein
MTNSRYEEDPAGGAEDQRRSDTVRLSAAAATFTEGGQYRQVAHELHASSQQPGTVTAIRCSWVEAPELTVCLRDEGSWRSGQGRDATREEIKTVAAKALE